ncbi:MAG: tRNA preQ1(34) S-adenosylmethionine ribosyltransferase-isomerase QueA [Candidatus Hinthialibacter sp.]
MDISAFDYHLPSELIAQEPAGQRDHSRLLIVDRCSRSIREGLFFEAPDLLDEGDLLVLNDTYVFPARLLGRKEPGGAAIEMLLLESMSQDEWEVIAYRASRLKEGVRVVFSDRLFCEVIRPLGDGKFHVRFTWEGEWNQTLAEHGLIPLPPYIERNSRRSLDQDRERYQTVFAQRRRPYDSAAAPTASLHFTDQIFQRLRDRGIETAYLTLRIGLDTFLPVREDRVEDHVIHSEAYSIPPETAERINETLAKGKRVIAVGTTVVRTLESAADEQGRVQAGENRSRLYIYPGYQFKVVKSMFTNFHLPRTTLLLLISAFMGDDLRKQSYEYAVQKRFRFYSYGDSMLIL